MKNWSLALDTKICPLEQTWHISTITQATNEGLTYLNIIS